MKGDNWSLLNELVQNLVVSGIAVVWLSMIYYGRPVSQSLDLAFAAVLVFLGMKSYRK
jgi:hypothetical protein